MPTDSADGANTSQSSLKGAYFPKHWSKENLFPLTECQLHVSNRNRLVLGRVDLREGGVSDLFVAEGRKEWVFTLLSTA